MSNNKDKKKIITPKFFDSYLGTPNIDNFVLEPIPKHLDILNTNDYDIRDYKKNILIQPKEEIVDKKKIFFKEKYTFKSIMNCNFNIHKQYKN